MKRRTRPPGPYVLGLALGLAALAVAVTRWTEVTTSPRAPDSVAAGDATVIRHKRTAVSPQIQWRTGTAKAPLLALTTADGAGLRLVSVAASIVIENPLAFTELHLTFENPEDRRREGRFELELPPDAAFSRLAMMIDDRWMEGEIVERRKGQTVFENFIHARPWVDPGLLEQTSANRVSARVFPIDPRQRKEIIVSYSQPLGGSDAGAYRLPLQGLPEVELFDVHIIVVAAVPDANAQFPTSSQRVVHVKKRDYSPDQDLVVTLEGAQPAVGIRSGKQAAVRMRPRGADAGEPVDDLVILFDTSASVGRHFGHEVERLAGFLAELGEAKVRVVAFDQATEVVYEGPANEALGEPLTSLRQRRALGASNLAEVLASAEARASGRRVLVWSDGVATAGPTDHGALTKAARRLGATRIDACASGDSTDGEVLHGLVAAGGHPGIMLGSRKTSREIHAALAQRASDPTAISVAGATWWSPRTLAGVVPGDDLVIYAEFPGEAPEALQVDFADPHVPAQMIPTASGSEPLLRHAIASARAAELQRQIDTSESPAEVESTREQLVRLALSHRLLTAHTALLVLESEAEYRGYGIDRGAPADILTVGPRGIEVRSTDREHVTSDDDPSVPPDDRDVWGGLAGTAVGEGAGVPGLGLIGTGRGGGGSGYGYGSGDNTIGLGSTGTIGSARAGSGHADDTIGLGSAGIIGPGHGPVFGKRSPPPRVRLGRPAVNGALDPDVVRRIARTHINEVRFLYEQNLAAGSGAEGKIEIRFTVGSTGQVLRADVASNSSGDEALGTRLATVVRRWQFPPGRGDEVVVTLAFTFGAHATTTPSSRLNTSQARRRRGDPVDGPRWVGSAHRGRFAHHKRRIAAGDNARAAQEAWEWADAEPRNVLALVALGEVLELEGQPELAGRVYGSLIDHYPGRADMRRAAGMRLEATGEPGRALAIDSYQKAVEQRPDQINGQRLLAWALAKQGAYGEAFAVLTAAIATPPPADRFRGVNGLLHEDRSIIAAAWLAAEPDATAKVETRLRAAGVRPSFAPSLRVVADWQTDASDVDILVDPIGPGDGRRHADVRTGFGPEAWVARGKARPKAVNVRVRYFDRGAMGYTLGGVSSVAHDGAGKLRFDDRPFVLMQASGSVELGRFDSGE